MIFQNKASLSSLAKTQHGHGPRSHSQEFIYCHTLWLTYFKDPCRHICDYLSPSPSQLCLFLAWASQSHLVLKMMGESPLLHSRKHVEFVLVHFKHLEYFCSGTIWDQKFLFWWLLNFKLKFKFFCRYKAARVSCSVTMIHDRTLKRHHLSCE